MYQVAAVNANSLVGVIGKPHVSLAIRGSDTSISSQQTDSGELMDVICQPARQV
jgi:hypothetical protein